MPGSDSQTARSWRDLVLWNYPRGSWQYDLIVIAILSFIFLTPATVFHDQPRPRQVVLLPRDNGRGVYWIEPEPLAAVPESERGVVAARIIRDQLKQRVTVISLAPVATEDGGTRGYLAYTNP